MSGPEIPGALGRSAIILCMRLLMLIILAATMAAVDDPLPRTRPATWAQPVIGGGPENFFKVSDLVWRSAQPDEKQMLVLEKLGIKSVVNLREYHSDEDETEHTGLKMVRVKLDAGRLDAPGLKRALDALRAAEKPALVHCWHGSDRTGALIAVWRMVEEKWPREAAIDEFVNGGYGYHEDWFPEIKDLLKTIDLEQLRAKP